MTNLPSRYCSLQTSFHVALKAEFVAIPYLLNSIVTETAVSIQGGDSTSCTQPSLLGITQNALEKNTSLRVPYSVCRPVHTKNSSLITVLESFCGRDEEKTGVPHTDKIYLQGMQLGWEHFDSYKSRERPKSCHIVRPLLSCSRDLITAVCQNLEIPVYPDKSNHSVQYSRNRIRKQILPSIQIFLNPKVEDALFEFAQLVCQEQSMNSRYESGEHLKGRQSGSQFKCSKRKQAEQHNPLP